MKAYLSQEFVEKFPEYIRISVVVQGIEELQTPPKLKGMLRTLQETLRAQSLADVEDKLISWECAFRRAQMDPVEFKPSVIALVDRIREDAELDLSTGNAIVDIANYISIKHLIPCGVDDLDKIQGDFGLKMATGNEIFVGIGSNRVERPTPGEIIYADKRKVLCRRWVWKQGVHTKVDLQTINAIINLDILPPVTYEEAKIALKDLVKLLEEFTGGNVSTITLTKEKPEAEIGRPAKRREIEYNVYDELELRGYIEQTTNRDTIKALLSSTSAPTTIYEGFDPTKPSLHVGHLMSLMVMHYLQEAGHRIIFILGGGTAQIGDPSGRLRGREMISPEEVNRNGEAIKMQVQKMKLVNFEKNIGNKPPAIMLNNYDWLNMPFFKYAREITPYFSVNAMVKREDFKKRLDDNINLSLFEFLYTTLQAYDFLYLYDKYNCLIQMGGNDQWINILDGIDLIRRKRNGEAHAMTFPLLVDRAGQKMGKTSGGKTVWLAAEGPYSTSPFEFYQYWVNTPDEDLERNFKIFTFLSLEEIDKILSGDPREAQHRLAYEVTKIVHGEEIAKQVQIDAFKAFGYTTGLPKDVPTFTVDESSVLRGIYLRELLVKAKALPSKSEAKRLIEQGAVRLGSRKIVDPFYKLQLDDFEEIEGERAMVIRFGKGKVLKVKLE